MTPGQPLALRIVQLAVFGAVNSIQFTAMNAVTLKDLAEYEAVDLILWVRGEVRVLAPEALRNEVIRIGEALLRNQK